MGRSRPVIAAGIGAAILSNYWVLEGLLAKRDDAVGSWISDLAARSEAYGWRFETLEIVSGLAVMAFALLLLPRLGRLAPAMRYGLFALVVEGGLTVVGGAFRLSCAETLDPSCSLRYDAADVVHASAEVAATLATILAFLLIALALIELGRRRAAQTTIAIGVVWIVLALLTGIAYLNGDLDSIKGALQRASQVIFGAWLILLAVWASVGDQLGEPRSDRPPDRVGVLE